MSSYWCYVGNGNCALFWSLQILSASLSLPLWVSYHEWKETLEPCPWYMRLLLKWYACWCTLPSLLPSILSLLRSCYNYCRTVRGRQVCKQEAARATHIFALSHITKLQCLSERALKKPGSFSFMCHFLMTSSKYRFFLIWCMGALIIHNPIYTATILCFDGVIIMTRSALINYLNIVFGTGKFTSIRTLPCCSFCCMSQ